jgi:hypothetical protein
MIRSKENTTNKAHDIIRRAENNQSVLSPIENMTMDASTQVKPENKVTNEINVQFPKQERSTMERLGNDLFGSNEGNNIQVTDIMVEEKNHANNDNMVTFTGPTEPVRNTY